MGSLCPDITLDSFDFRVECQSAKGRGIWSTEMQETICVQKTEKVFDTTVHKSFQRFHIYYISFTETILILSAWVPLLVIFSH